MTIRKDKIENIGMTIFVIILTLIPVSLCFNRNIWLDEGFSLRWSMLPFPDFLQRMKLDVCPFYLSILRIVLTLTNENIYGAKLFSVLPIVLILIIGVTFVRRRFGEKTAVFFCLFILFTPMMLKKAVEIRMYSWAYLLVVFSAVEMYKLISNTYTKKDWILFTISGIAGAYTHYFAIFALAVIYGGMFVFFVFTKNRKQVKSWLICAVITVFAYLPWVPNVLNQSSSATTSWIQPSTSRLGPIRGMFYSNIPYTEHIFLLLLLGFMLLGVVLFCKHRTFELYWSLVCMSTVWCVLIFGHVFEKISRPILVDRYLMIPLCVSILGMTGVCKYVSKYLLIYPCIFFCIVGITTYPEIYQEEYVTNTEKTLSFAEEYIAEDAIIVTDVDSLASVIPYYFPKSQWMDVEKIYNGEYDVVWYFDVDKTIDIQKLEQLGINYRKYENYGFDNVNFTIYHLTTEE